MSSIIIKIFTGILATFLAHRIISIVLSLIVCFLVYKYFTDPRYITNLIKSIKEIVDSFGGGESKKIGTEKLSLLF